MLLFNKLSLKIAKSTKKTPSPESFFHNVVGWWAIKKQNMNDSSTDDDDDQEMFAYTNLEKPKTKLKFSLGSLTVL